MLKVTMAILASLVTLPGFGFTEKSQFSQDKVLPSVEDFQRIQDTLEIEKQREIDRLSQVASAGHHSKERVSACIALAVYFQDIDPQLSQHYISMARIAKDPFQDAGNLNAALSYFRVHNTINFQLTGYESELIKLSQNTNLPWKMKKFTFELLLNHYWQKGEHNGFIDTFEAYKEKVPSFTIAEDQVKRAVTVYKTAKKKSKYFENLELLTTRFPLSAESIWAFDQLANHASQDAGEYAFDFGFLRKLYLNSSVDNESREKVLALLNYPIKRDFTDKPAPLSDMEKLRFLIRIRDYEKALTLSSEIANGADKYAASIARLWSAFALGRLGRYSEALEIFQAAQTNGYGLYGFFLEAYAEVLMRSGDHEKAAEHYAELVSKQNNYRLRWYYFWNLYKSKQTQKALSLLRSRQPLFAPSANQLDSRNYWSFKLSALSTNDVSGPEFHGLRRHYYKTLFETYKNPTKFGQVKPEAMDYGNSERIGLSVLQSKPEDDSIDRVEDLQSSYGDKQVLLASNGDIPVGTQMSETHDEALMQQLSISRSIDELKVLSFKREVNIIANGLNVDPLLIFSLIKAESSFNPVAMSSIGARGLMQIMPYTALKLSKQIGDNKFKLEDLADPVTSIVYGSIYFNMLLKAYDGNMFVAIAAYNAGPEAVNEWLNGCQACSSDDFVELIPFKETRAYVKKVVSYYSEYRLKSEQDLAFEQLPKLPSVPTEIASSLF